MSSSESGDSTNGSSHPVHRGRARRRSSGRRGASTSSTRGFRSRSRAGGNLHMLQDDTPNLLQDRDDVMKMTKNKGYNESLSEPMRATEHKALLQRINNTDTLNADYYKRAVEAIEDKVDKKPRYTFTFSVDLDEEFNVNTSVVTASAPIYEKEYKLGYVPFVYAVVDGYTMTGNDR
ncbi:hypothetical protein ACF0H5_023459 [Mactra antiquata]